MSISVILNKLSQLSGNSKLSALDEYLNSENSEHGRLLEKVLHNTYHSDLNYYIRPTAYSINQGEAELSLYRAIDMIVDNLTTRKLTGNNAQQFFLDVTAKMHPDDAEVLCRIVNRDLGIGVNTTTANKVLKRPIPTFNVMLCGKSDPKNIKRINFAERPYVQEKSDGLRIIITVNGNGDVQFRTRSGKELRFDHMVPAFAKFPNTAFDGEALVVDDNNKILDRKTGNGILNSIQKNDLTRVKQVRFVLWDMINYTLFLEGLDPTPYNVRFDSLVAALDGELSEFCFLQTSTRVDSLEEVESLFQQMLSVGKEGVILKAPNAPYECKRVPYQIKFKAENDCDLLLVDMEEGTGKNVGRLGAFVLQDATGTLIVNVGTGFSDAERDQYWNQKNELIGKVVAVQYNEVITTKSRDTKSLFLPVFLELRVDKETADSF
jgi:ATP-dependent DNA ligase